MEGNADHPGVVEVVMGSRTCMSLTVKVIIIASQKNPAAAKIFVVRLA